MSQQFGAEPSSLRELILQSGQGLYIPVYQRGFTWGKSEIVRLFEDLDYGIERAAQGQNSPTFLGSVILLEDRSSVTPKHSDALPPQVLHIVDGQQRLTAILLIFAVIARFIAKQLDALGYQKTGNKSSSNFDYWITNNLQKQQNCLLESIAFSTTGEEEFQYKPRLIRQESDVWGNNITDAKYESDVAWYLMEIVRKREKGEVNLPLSFPTHRQGLSSVISVLNDAVGKIADGETECDALNNLTYLHDRIVTGNLVGSSPELLIDLPVLDVDCRKAIRLFTVASFLLSGVLVIDVRAPNEDYAFTLFEPLNTTGQQLSSIETLKPLVVNAEGGVEKYKNSPSDENFSLIEERFHPQMKADEKVKQTADLIISFALAETGEKLPKSPLSQQRYLRSQFRSLESVAENTGRDLISFQREFVKDLSQSCVFLFDVWKQKDVGPLGRPSGLEQLAIEVLSDTSHTIVIPILTQYWNQWIRTRTDVHRDNFFEILKGLTAFWTLWRTSRPTTRGIDDIHRQLMTRGYTERGFSLSPLARHRGEGLTLENLPSPVKIKDVLRNILKIRGKICAKQDWIHQVVNQPIYQNAKKLAKFLLLAAYEDYIEDEENPGLFDCGVAGTFLCFNANAWESSYTVEHIAPQSPNVNDTSYEKQIYERPLIDRLGNLTLMPGKLNSLLGNKDWEFKRDIYQVLSEPSPAKRVEDLQDRLPGLAPGTRSLINSSDYLPFCKFLPKNTDSVLSADFIIGRGERLASLAWNRLWPLLH